MVGTPLLVLGSFGVAWSRTVPELMVWRFVQAVGASPGLAVGSGVVGDIYKLEERGKAMGIFFAVYPSFDVSFPKAHPCQTHRQYC